MNLRKILGQQGFKTVKCNPFQSSSSFFICTFLLYLVIYTFRAVLYIEADPGGPWYLTFALGPLENHTNHMLGTWDFTGSEHRAPFNFF